MFTLSVVADSTKEIAVVPLFGKITTARVAAPTKSSILLGIMAYRWLTLAWFVVVYSWEVYRRNILGNDPFVAHPLSGFILCGFAIAHTSWLTYAYRKDPKRILRVAEILVEIAIAALLIGLDMWVYQTEHSQSLPSMWIVSPVFVVAIAAGRRTAVVAGIGLGVCRYIGWLPFAEDSSYSIARLGTIFFLGIAGWIAGYIMIELAKTDRSISAFKAREEIARTLHDGVLQTLAIIQRTSEDTKLVNLARTQEKELRDYLFGTYAPHQNLATGLRSVARKAEQRYPIKVEVVTAPDLKSQSDFHTQTLCKAAGEAVTNAAKHGPATQVTIYAEPADRGIVFVSVKDNGKGFATEAVDEGQGISRSIRGRIEGSGGRVEITSRLDRGTEVKMWL